METTLDSEFTETKPFTFSEQTLEEAKELYREVIRQRDKKEADAAVPAQDKIKPQEGGGAPPLVNRWNISANVLDDISARLTAESCTLGDGSLIIELTVRERTSYPAQHQDMPFYRKTISCVIVRFLVDGEAFFQLGETGAIKHVAFHFLRTPADAVSVRPAHEKWESDEDQMPF